MILLTTIKSIGNTSERKGKQNRTFHLKAFFSVSIKFLWFLIFMIATQEGLKMVMTITWRLSIFRKKKITFTKIAFEKFMKVLLHDILSSWYNTTGKCSWKVVSILFSNDLVLKIQYSKLSLAYLHAENIFFLIFFLSSDRTFGRLIQYDFLLEEDIALVMTTVFGRKQRYCFSDKQTS